MVRYKNYSIVQDVHGDFLLTYTVHVVQYMSIISLHTLHYSNYSVVSLSHYSSSTVVLTVIGVLVNSTPQ